MSIVGCLDVSSNHKKLTVQSPKWQIVAFAFTGCSGQNQPKSHFPFATFILVHVPRKIVKFAKSSIGDVNICEYEFKCRLTVDCKI